MSFSPIKINGGKFVTFWRSLSIAKVFSADSILTIAAPIEEQDDTALGNDLAVSSNRKQYDPARMKPGVQFLSSSVEEFCVDWFDFMLM